MYDGNNMGLVSVNYYNPAVIYNRVGQFFYRTGDITKAKMLFLLSAFYSGKFNVQNAKVN